MAVNLLPGILQLMGMMKIICTGSHAPVVGSLLSNINLRAIIGWLPPAVLRDVVV